MGLATARATVSICGAAAASPSSIAKPLHPRTHCHFLPTSLFSSCYSIACAARVSISNAPLELASASTRMLDMAFFQSSKKKCKLNLQKSVQDTTGSKVSCSLLNVESVIDDDACELVSGEELSLEDGDDDIHAYLFKAVKNNNGIGLLLLSDVYGFEDSSTRDFAYRVACNGFNILLPDLFRGNPWTKDQPNTQFEQWIAGHNPERIAKDITAWTEWLADEFMTEGVSRKLGIIGFCFGGGKVLEVLAQDQDACFGTGISFYGTGIDSLVASDVKVPVLFILGDSDPLCAVSEIKNIQTTIDSGGSKVVIFPGRGHGFAHRPGSVEEDKDAEQAYVIMRDWIHEHLV